MTHPQLLRHELGLTAPPGALLDIRLWVSMAVGLMVLYAGRLWLGSDGPAVAGLYPVLSFVLWQPLLEELFFRGVLQGQIHGTAVGRKCFAGISLANLLTSLCFVCLHLLHHSPGWAIAVFVPSLLFGYFRDRHESLLPGLFLHVAFNTGYLIAGLP